MTLIFVGSARSLRAAARTAVFVSKVLPMVPSRPIDWVTTAPVVERVRYLTPLGEADGDLYRPAGAGPHPGVVVCLGVVPFGVDHPQVPRLGAALARAGFAALLYWSPAMHDQRLDPQDVEGIAMAYRWLIERPTVDASRSGLLGTCVGGSFALMAAADPCIRDRVAFVVAWAPYASIRTLARDIASATSTSDGVTTPWQVDPLTRRVYVRSLTAVLEPEEAALLRNACADRGGRVDDHDLSAEGRAVHSLLTALDSTAAETALDHLPPAMQGRLDAMSPMGCVRNIQAPLILLAHDRDDAVIPIGETRHLVTTLTGRAGVSYTEFTMFKHLDPSEVRLPLVALARELTKFYRAVYPMFRQAVGP